MPSPETVARPWRTTDDGIELTVRLTPSAGRSGIDGVAEAGGRAVLKIRVAAPPVDDAANAALVAFLAEALSVPKSAVRLTAGRRARIKTLRIDGPDLPARLAVLLG